MRDWIPLREITLRVELDPGSTERDGSEGANRDEPWLLPSTGAGIPGRHNRRMNDE